MRRGAWLPLPAPEMEGGAPAKWSARVGWRDVEPMEARRYVHCVLLERGAGHDLERRFVRRRQYDIARLPIPVGAEPVHGRHTPAIARDEPGEAVLGHRSDEVVAYPALVLEELGRNDRTNCMRAKVFRPAGAAAVTVEAGQRLEAARLEFASEDVTLLHASQYPPAATTQPVRAGRYWPAGAPTGAGRTCSGADELGLPGTTLEERAHPDLGVAGGERPGEKVALQRQALRQR